MFGCVTIADGIECLYLDLKVVDKQNKPIKNASVEVTTNPFAFRLRYYEIDIIKKKTDEQGNVRLYCMGRMYSERTVIFPIFGFILSRRFRPEFGPTTCAVRVTHKDYTPYYLSVVLRQGDDGVTHRRIILERRKR